MAELTGENGSPQPVAEDQGAASRSSGRGGRWRQVRRRPFAVLGAVIALGLLTLLIYVIATHGEENTDDAYVQSDVVPVGVRVAGQIVNVPIVENQTVEKGQILAVIDNAEYAARFRQAEAELASAQAQSAAANAQVQVVEATSRGGLATAQAALTGSSAGVSGAAAQVAAAEAAVARARADETKAGTDLRRAETLRRANAIPQERLDSARAAYDGAHAARLQAEAQVKAARDERRSAQERVREAQGRVNQSAPVEPQIEAARANLALAQARAKSAAAALDQARLLLSYTEVRAPAAGWASKLSVHPGQMVLVGQPVVQLVPRDTYVVANFKETQLGRMKPGQPADMKVDAFGGRHFRGRVESLSGGTGATFALLPPENATGNFVKVVQRVPVRIAWVDLPSDVPMRAGLSVDVTVHVNR